MNAIRPTAKDSQPMNRLITVFLFLISISQFTLASGLSKEDKERLLNGELTLKYSMFGKGASGSAGLRKLYDERKWEELVAAVTSKGFVVSTYYYYLGRAAEEMGAKAAATRYFDLVIESKKSVMESCTDGGMWDTCAGFKFPNDAITRKAMLADQNLKVLAKYEPGSGPKIKDVVDANFVTLAELTQTQPNQKISRDKFETEQEYSARLSKGANRYLVILKIKTDADANCLSSYKHDGGVYSIERCPIIAEGRPVTHIGDIVNGLVLANMFDRREIKTLRTKEIYFQTNFTWSQSMKIPLETAKLIDSDLYAAVLIDDFNKTESCPACESRRRREQMANLIDSVGAAQGRRIDTSDVDWKKDAFKSGAVAEDFVYEITPKKVLKYFVFSGQDGRIIFEASN